MDTWTAWTPAFFLAVNIVFMQAIPIQFGHLRHHSSPGDIIAEINSHETGKNFENRIVEGDILVIDPPSSSQQTNKKHRVKRNTLGHKSESLWKDGIIPYVIDRNSSYGPDEIKIIQDTIKYMNNIDECIQFVDYTDAKEKPAQYVLITSELDRCASYVGHVKTPIQKLYLGHSRFGTCILHYLIKHELMHLLGFFHEHTRADRDEYVTINEDNIRQGAVGNFLIEPSSNALGLAYDPSSIMQYSDTAFSKNGEKTITFKANPSLELGGYTLSNIDKQQLMQLYSRKCAERDQSKKKSTTTTMKTPTTTTLTTPTTTTTMTPTKTTITTPTTTTTMTPATTTTTPPTTTATSTPTTTTTMTPTTTTTITPATTTITTPISTTTATPTTKTTMKPTTTTTMRPTTTTITTPTSTITMTPATATTTPPTTTTTSTPTTTTTMTPTTITTITPATTTITTPTSTTTATPTTETTATLTTTTMTPTTTTTMTPTETTTTTTTPTTTTTATPRSTTTTTTMTLPTTTPTTTTTLPSETTTTLKSTTTPISPVILTPEPSECKNIHRICYIIDLMGFIDYYCQYDLVKQSCRRMCNSC